MTQKFFPEAGIVLTESRAKLFLACMVPFVGIFGSYFMLKQPGWVGVWGAFSISVFGLFGLFGTYRLIFVKDLGTLRFTADGLEMSSGHKRAFIHWRDFLTFSMTIDPMLGPTACRYVLTKNASRPISVFLGPKKGVDGDGGIHDGLCGLSSFETMTLMKEWKRGAFLLPVESRRACLTPDTDSRFSAELLQSIIQEHDLRCWRFSPDISVNDIQQAIGKSGSDSDDLVSEENIIAIYTGSADRAIVLRDKIIFLTHIFNDPPTAKNSRTRLSVAIKDIEAVSASGMVDLTVYCRGARQINWCSVHRDSFLRLFISILRCGEPAALSAGDTQQDNPIDLKQPSEMAAEEDTGVEFAVRDQLESIVETRLSEFQIDSDEASRLHHVICSNLQPSTALMILAKLRAKKTLPRRLCSSLPHGIMLGLLFQITVGMLTEMGLLRRARLFTYCTPSESTFDLYVKADSGLQQFRKWFGSVTLGAAIGGYFGAILGADAASISSAQEALILHVELKKLGSKNELMFAGNSDQLLNFLVVALSIAEFRALLGLSLGITSWPPQSSALLPTPESLKQGLNSISGRDLHELRLMANLD
jgi:hypothetical protein